MVSLLLLAGCDNGFDATPNSNCLQVTRPTSGRNGVPKPGGSLRLQERIVFEGILMDPPSAGRLKTSPAPKPNKRPAGPGAVTKLALLTTPGPDPFWGGDHRLVWITFYPQIDFYPPSRGFPLNSTTLVAGQQKCGMWIDIADATTGHGLIRVGSGP